MRSSSPMSRYPGAFEPWGSEEGQVSVALGGKATDEKLQVPGLGIKPMTIRI
ncbi:hypothetical protein RP20_CCG008855 [Aedes albopictus]|nr:hypothetical protein RP20_CCG008855 [Aedes albopictus]